jgi:hypothetical protein
LIPDLLNVFHDLLLNVDVKSLDLVNEHFLPFATDGAPQHQQQGSFYIVTG